MDMQDSGQRQEFGTGAQRDTAEDKPRPELISPFAEERLGHWLRRGAEKYEARNWEKGMPFSRCVASLQRHLIAVKKGERDEDHLAAILFNAMALIHYQEMIERGVLDADLDDLPDYTPRYSVHHYLDQPKPKSKPLNVPWIDPNEPVSPMGNQADSYEHASEDGWSLDFNQLRDRVERRIFEESTLPASVLNMLQDENTSAVEALQKAEELGVHFGPMIPSETLLNELVTMANRVSLDYQIGPFYTAPNGDTSTCLEDVEVHTRALSEVEHRGICLKLNDQGCPEDIQQVIAGGTRVPAGSNDHRRPRPFVYIAGPMRGYDEFNFPAFDKARDRWARDGYCTISPADADRAAGTDGSDDTPYYPDTDKERVRGDVVRDIHAIYSLDPDLGDKLALIRGWQKSTGALAEFALARWLGVPTVAAETGEELALTGLPYPARRDRKF